MKPRKFTFYFKGGNITVSALNYDQGKILAQAEAIKNGWDCEVCTYSVDKPEDKPITLRDFLRKKTQALELCAITDGGWIVATCYIDHEDLFHIPPRLADKEVKSDGWDYISIVNANGIVSKIPCHYVNV